MLPVAGNVTEVGEVCVWTEPDAYVNQFLQTGDEPDARGVDHGARKAEGDQARGRADEREVGGGEQVQSIHRVDVTFQGREAGEGA